MNCVIKAVCPIFDRHAHRHVVLVAPWRQKHGGPPAEGRSGGIVDEIVLCVWEILRASLVRVLVPGNARHSRAPEGVDDFGG